MAFVAGELVWLRIAQPRKNGPFFAPEIWPVDSPSHGTKQADAIAARHPLNDDEIKLKLAILEQRYPAPKEDT
jgi:hypothetical protein